MELVEPGEREPAARPSCTRPSAQDIQVADHHHRNERRFAGLFSSTCWICVSHIGADMAPASVRARAELRAVRSRSRIPRTDKALHRIASLCSPLLIEESWKGKRRNLRDIKPLVASTPLKRT